MTDQFKMLKKEVMGDNLIKEHQAHLPYMVSKIIVGYIILVLSYLLYISSNTFIQVIFGCLALGLSIYFIQTALMHDASHNAVFKKPLFNKILTYMTTGTAGLNATNWIKKHVVTHHTSPNEHEFDPDIGGNGVFRFHPEEPRTRVIRFQHYYFPFLYAFLALQWLWLSDIKNVIYNKNLLTKKKLCESRIEFVISRIIHVVFLILIPAYFLGFWTAIIGYFAVCLFTGFLLAFTFQPAHVIDSNDFPTIDDKPRKLDWVERQLNTTANFATKNRVMTYLTGGLNYQIEHHLFPNICHYYYPRLSKIVKEFCGKNNINYKEFPTYKAALHQHIEHLKLMGKQ